MLNSRKLFNALAVTGLLTLGSVASFAADCNGGSIAGTNLALRPEGLTELTGDVTVSCPAGSPLPASFSVLVQLPANVDIANGTSALPTLTPTGGAAISGTLSTLPNAINFNVPASGGATGFTIAGLRVNANKAAGASVSTVTASLIISTGSTLLSLGGNPALVGTILPKSITFSVVGGLDATVASASSRSLPQCVSNSSVAGFFRYIETFAGVLRQQSQEGPAATNGTQIRIVLSNIPAGITLYVPNGNSAAADGTFVTGNNTFKVASGISSTVATTINVGGLTQPAGDTPATGIGTTLTFGAVTGSEIVYEVVASATSSTDTLNIPFVVSYTGGPSVGIGTASAKGTLAPVTGDKFPKFADVGETASAFSTTICATTLLFPYVTTDAGFDTGVAISNTTADPSRLGTPNQSGTCDVSAFGAYGSGATVPAAGTSPTISAGRTWAFSLTDSAVFASGAKLGSGFNGYLIAQCNFQLAHGYAFVSTYGLSGANSVAQGYLALVLTKNDGSRVSGATIEQLAH